MPSDRRELAGWVVREAVTNVVRHAGASLCRVSLDGRSVEVARMVHLSEGTMKNHLSSAIGKTGGRNRADAVRVAVERGWL